MGGDLYNSLIRYFVQYLRRIWDVCRWGHDNGTIIDVFRSIPMPYNPNLS